MATLREGLLRLSAASAAAGARGWAARVHTRVLLLAVLLAWVSAALLPLPGLDGLRGQWLASLAVAAVLVLLGLALRLVARPWLRTRPERLAARLDDERGWKDTASTALEIERGSVSSSLGGVLVDRAASLVEGIPLEVVAPVRRRRPWLRIALVALFLAAFLLPGVDGGRGRSGAGRSGPLGAGAREEPTGAMDADEWLRRHATLHLGRDLVGAQERPLGLLAGLTTRRAIPEPYAGDLTLLWDDAPRAPAGRLVLPKGTSGGAATGTSLVGIDLAQIDELKPYLTPGKHRARVRLVPTQPPFTLALLSNEVEVTVPEPQDGGGGGGQPPPQPPPPQQPPPPPQPTPPQDPGEPPPPPPPGGREEAVKPIVNDGETVKKDTAVVEVKDLNAGTKPPPSVPLAEALRDFTRLVEEAVGSERIPPADRDYLRRYFRALQGLVAPEGAPPR